jgi:hypothetical protein
MSATEDNHDNDDNRNKVLSDTSGAHGVESVNSGSYHPGPVTDDQQSAELSYVQAQQNDLLLEEFPDGPYGAATNEPLGKSAPWKDGQRSISAFRDQNPAFSDRKVPLDEPDTDGAPRGTIEGQN